MCVRCIAQISFSKLFKIPECSTLEKKKSLWNSPLLGSQLSAVSIKVVQETASDLHGFGLAVSNAERATL